MTQACALTAVCLEKNLGRPVGDNQFERPSDKGGFLFCGNLSTKS